MEIQNIGDCTLYLGDCLEILPTLGKVDAVVTDPPYGIKWKRGENKSKNSKSHSGIQGDENVEIRDCALNMINAPGAVFGSFYTPHPKPLKQILVWKKSDDLGLVGAVTGFRRDVEPVFLIGEWPIKKQHRTALLTAPKPKTNITEHPHTKPTQLVELLILALPGLFIIDPFMGSGTTGVACVNLGRKFIGIEIEPKYFDIACSRIECAYSQRRLFA